VVLAAVAYTDRLAASATVIAPYRIGQAARDEKTVRTFHIGNSLTDTVVGWLQPVAESTGRKLDFHRFTIPALPPIGSGTTRRRLWRLPLPGGVLRAGPHRPHLYATLPRPRPLDRQ